MASSIDIEVNLDSKQALKGLDKLEGAGEAVGESFGSMGEAVGKLGGEMNEQLGAVGETVGGLSSSFVDLSSAVSAPGASFMSLLGPIGAVMIAVVELANAFDDYSGKTKESEMRVEAYEAATAELTGAVEELSAAQVTLNAEQIEQLKILSMSAKEPLELAQNIRTANGTRKESIRLIDEQIKLQLEQVRVQSSLVAGYVNLTRVESLAVKRLRQQREELQKKVDEGEARALELTSQGAREFAKFEEEKENLLKQSPEFRKKIAEQELRIQEDHEIALLKSASDNAKSQTEVAIIESTRKVREIKAIEDISSKARDKAIRAESIRLSTQVAQIEKAFAEKRAAERQARLNKRLADERLANTKRLMLEQRTQQELFAIRGLQVQQLKQQGATELEIIEAQHQLEIDRAGDSANQRLMAEIRFEMAKTELVKSEEAKRQAERDKRQAEILKGIDERNDRERESIQIAGEIADSFGSAFAEASYGALAMGESFNDALVSIIHGLGKQAAVESLIQTAKGFASLAILDGPGAAAHFKAALGFAAGAAAAGVAANAIGGGSGGGGGGGASPSGAPQVAPTPERETAQETSTVFNINFGGAVIYDTKQAAERAMVDRIVGVMNQRNRGSRRLHLGRV